VQIVHQRLASCYVIVKDGFRVYQTWSKPGGKFSDESPTTNNMTSLAAVRAANAAFSSSYIPTALFVGGTSGIGQATAEAFARYTKGEPPSQNLPMAVTNSWNVMPR